MRRVIYIIILSLIGALSVTGMVGLILTESYNYKLNQEITSMKYAMDDNYNAINKYTNDQIYVFKTKYIKYLSTDAYVDYQYILTSNVLMKLIDYMLDELNCTDTQLINENCSTLVDLYVLIEPRKNMVQFYNDWNSLYIRDVYDEELEKQIPAYDIE